MKRLVVAIVLSLHAWLASAAQPYLAVDKVAEGDIKAVMASVERKLTEAGFQVAGRHVPKGISQHGVVVVTEPTLTEAVLRIGGAAVVFAPIRVGMKSDGSVSVVNLDYWGRAYLRDDFGKAEAAIKSVAAKLEKALGAGKPFGGEVKAEDLPRYRFMFGMERFDDRRAEIKEYPSFDAALKVVQANLGKQVANTAKIYELVFADKRLAVFGFSQNDAKKGEGWWVNKIAGADHVAALPWEVFVIDGRVMVLHARYRTALSWPSLTMGQFIGISEHPDYVMEMAEAIAGYQ